MATFTGSSLSPLLYYGEIRANLLPFSRIEVADKRDKGGGSGGSI